MQMEQVSSLWKASSVSESMFLKMKERNIEYKREKVFFCPDQGK